MEVPAKPHSKHENCCLPESCIWTWFQSRSSSQTGSYTCEEAELNSPHRSHHWSGCTTTKRKEKAALSDLHQKNSIGPITVFLILPDEIPSGETGKEFWGDVQGLLKIVTCWFDLRTMALIAEDATSWFVSQTRVCLIIRNILTRISGIFNLKSNHICNKTPQRKAWLITYYITLTFQHLTVKH